MTMAHFSEWEPCNLTEPLRLAPVGQALVRHNPSLGELGNLSFLDENDSLAFHVRLPRIQGQKTISYCPSHYHTLYTHHHVVWDAVKRNDLENIYVYNQEFEEEFRSEVEREAPFQGRVSSFHLKVNRNGLRPLMARFHDNEVPTEVALRLDGVDDGLDFICLPSRAHLRPEHAFVKAKYKHGDRKKPLSL
jgi:hypothetical protein